MAQAAHLLLRKYINILSSVQISPAAHPLYNVNCTVCLTLLCSSLPPSRSQPDVYLHFPVEAVRGGGPLLRRSLCRARAVVGRGGESNSSRCMEKGDSFHSSPLLTSTGFGV